MILLSSVQYTNEFLVAHDFSSPDYSFAEHHALVMKFKKGDLIQSPFDMGKVSPLALGEKEVCECRTIPGQFLVGIKRKVEGRSYVRWEFWIADSE